MREGSPITRSECGRRAIGLVAVHDTETSAKSSPHSADNAMGRDEIFMPVAAAAPFRDLKEKVMWLDQAEGDKRTSKFQWLKTLIIKYGKTQFFRN